LAAVRGTVGLGVFSPNHAVGGWYWLKKGMRRFAAYVPPVMEEPKLAEVERLPETA